MQLQGRLVLYLDEVQETPALNDKQNRIAMQNNRWQGDDFVHRKFWSSKLLQI